MPKIKQILEQAQANGCHITINAPFRSSFGTIARIFVDRGILWVVIAESDDSEVFFNFSIVEAFKISAPSPQPYNGK